MKKILYPSLLVFHEAAVDCCFMLEGHRLTMPGSFPTKNTQFTITITKISDYQILQVDRIDRGNQYFHRHLISAEIDNGTPHKRNIN